jgi:transcription factor E2F7/8
MGSEIMQTHIAENRKPAFRWLGTKDDLVGEATRMRISGTHIQTENVSTSPACSSLSMERTFRGLKRAGMDAPRLEPILTKRPALKPLQPRDPNIMTPYSRDIINKPVPLYPRPSQVDSPVSDPKTLTLPASARDASESPPTPTAPPSTPFTSGTTGKYF